MVKKDMLSEERTLFRLKEKPNGFWTVVRGSQVEAITMIINNPIRLYGISVAVPPYVTETTILESLEILEGLGTRSPNVVKIKEPIQLDPTVGDFCRRLTIKTNLAAGTFYTIVAKYSPGKTLMAGIGGMTSIPGEVDF